MPIQHAVWKVGEQPVPLATGRLASEQELEEMIAREPKILSNQWMIIGRQAPTKYGGRIDLLALAPDASLVLIELKRDRTPREIVAQAIDYASWVENLEAEAIAGIYHRFSGGRRLGEDYSDRFGAELDEDDLNQSHQVVLVAAELDPSTERIIGYLNARGIAINVAFFQVFQHAGEILLSRAWLIDPTETQVNAASTTESSRKKEAWNGEFYVSYGGVSRLWEEARDLGFISGGGGSWYSQTLKLLSPGDRIWVNIPKNGYVGVGRVTSYMTPAKEFAVTTNEGERPVLEALQHGDVFRRREEEDPEKGEYFVGVEWLDTVSASEAVNEVGLFGNQNTVCKPRTPKWRHTVERLKARFPGWRGD